MEIIFVKLSVYTINHSKFPLGYFFLKYMDWTKAITLKINRTESSWWYTRIYEVII